MMAFPHFAPDAELVVDHHNGPEHWTGAEWNEYVTAAERNSNMVTARLIECPEPVQLPAFDERDAESTSAALRRVQAELDAERDKRDEDIAAYERACGLAAVAERERDHWIKEHDKVIEVCVRMGQERDLARAELVSARTELDAVRTARDNLDRELADAYNTIRALVGLPRHPTEPRSAR